MRYTTVFEVNTGERKIYLGLDENIEVTLYAISYALFLKKTIKTKAKACLLILPIDNKLKGNPFSLMEENTNNRIKDIEKILKHLYGKIFNLLIPSGILLVYGYVQLLPYVINIFEKAERFYFRYWIVIERWDIINYNLPLRPVHEGLLLLIRYPYSLKYVNIVRSPHLKCLICGKLLKDWGGKKYKLHPDGYVIYDMWYEIPMYMQIVEDNYILFTEDVFNRIIKIVFNKRNNNLLPIILPDNIKGLRILKDLKSPLKSLKLNRHEIEVLRIGGNTNRVFK